MAAETREVADLDGLVGSYRIAARFCHWKDKGMLLATGTYEKGAVRQEIGWSEQRKWAWKYSQQEQSVLRSNDASMDKIIT